MGPEQTTLQLPISVTGLIDVGRLLREVEHLEGEVQAQSIRSDGQDGGHLPGLSQLLDEVVRLNQLDLAHAEHRQQLHAFLLDTKKNAPKIHVSFSANPSAHFVAELTSWLRNNIHPRILIAIGLQPGIGAGCVLRTTNRYFDMSLSKSFAGSRPILMKYLRDPALGLAPSAVAASSAPDTPVSPSPMQGVAA